jgi:hypothetical protein
MDQVIDHIGESQKAELEPAVAGNRRDRNEKPSRGGKKGEANPLDERGP